MKKSFIKLFSFIMIILIVLISACVLAYNYISDTIILNNEGENLTSILNSTNYVVNQKFENDFIYYNELIENITLSSETLEEKYETLNENKDKFVDLKTYDFGFGYLSTYLDGSECIRIGDVLYRDNNSRFNSKYLDNEVIMINFGRDCTTINDVPNKFEVKDYVLYRFGDIVIYISVDDYFMNIFKSTETITVEDYFIVSGDGKVSFQDDVTSSTMFYQLLRNEGNNETNVNEIIDDFNNDSFDKKVYSGITYNDQTCHLLSSTIENEFFASDLIMVQIIASNITRYPIKKVATPLLAIFIIIIVITVIAITGSYLFINKKNNDINEMINNEDKKKENETEEDIKKKSDEEIKQDCELNASKRLIANFREKYPRLPVRIIADSLYPSISLINLCEEESIEYIFVLKDKKIPTLLKEFLSVVSMPTGNREIEENKEKIKLTLWENEIDYKGKKINVIRQISKDKKTGKNSIWMWITNRKITRKNIRKIIYCAKQRDYIENQGFREQKVTSGIDLTHVYSKNIKAIKVIYTIIQITHLILQIIEHSDICGDFSKKYGSVKVFRRKFYAHLTLIELNIEHIQTKIQIRFNKLILI